VEDVVRFIAATVYDYRVKTDLRSLLPAWYDTADPTFDRLRPITIPEGADRVMRCVSSRDGVSDYRLVPKNDWTHAVSIHPGWQTFGDGLGLICHLCYAARRQAGRPCSVEGPNYRPGHADRIGLAHHRCADCGAEIPFYEETTSKFFAKKRPATWER